MKELFEIYNQYYDQHITSGHSAPTVCPHCNSKSILSWEMIAMDDYEKYTFKDYEDCFAIVSECLGCRQLSLFFKSEKDDIEHLAFPNKLTGIPSPNEDMPEDIKKLYIEASEVLSVSPRASAALSRLAIDQLTTKLNPNGKSLNHRISNLVKKGLPEKIQKALDAVRVIGNNAVHPGEIKFEEDSSEISITLLQLINVIVDYVISQPKQINQIYETLPKDALEAIEKRNNNIRNEG